MSNIKFSHIWDRYMGWSGTTIKPEDFVTVEVLGDSPMDGIIYLAITANGSRYIFRDFSYAKKMK